MSEFTARANMKNFETQHRTSSDEIQKATLRTLLSKERQLRAEPLTEPALSFSIGYGNLRICTGRGREHKWIVARE